MNTKLTFGLMMAMLLAAPFAFAQAATENQGIMPDSPLYGLDRAFEKLELIFASTKAEKAKIAIAHAQERLVEIKIMINQEKFTDADKALQGQKEDLADAIKNANEVRENDKQKEMEEKLEIEQKLKEHQEQIGQVESEVQLTKNAGADAEKIQHLNEIFMDLKGNAFGIQKQIQASQDVTKQDMVMVVRKGGKPEAEAVSQVDQEEQKLRARKGLDSAPTTRGY